MKTGPDSRPSSRVAEGRTSRFESAQTQTVPSAAPETRTFRAAQCASAVTG